MRKTAVFVVAGIGMLLLGTVAQPRFKSRNVQPEAERLLFPEFSDAGKAASLEILTYDDELATLQPFKVVQTGGVWVLPSQQNYPADAKDQLAVAATELIDRPILEVVSTSPGDHETYGVIEPDADKITPGMLMASLRLNIPTVFVSGGPMEAGKVKWQGKTIAVDLIDAMIKMIIIIIIYNNVTVRPTFHF